MAHFAKLDDNNVVLQVNLVDEIHMVKDGKICEEAGVEFLIDWSGGYTNWKQTCYEGSFRKNYAGIGFTYDPLRDAFIPPKPYESWILHEKCFWIPPVDPPRNGGRNMAWNEIDRKWVEVLLPKQTPIEYI